MIASKLTSEHRAPTRREAQNAVVPFRGNGSNPMVHPTFDRVCRHKFSQGGTHKALEDKDEDKPVDYWGRQS
jgi:hypothetical protein